ncbi:MAG: T9SS type A sorting domain-containing protein [Ignavibacteriales bacterium]|nr:T9SS type A sorting domain-containing protein [Ignavibacteriales bacterium]
MKNCFLLVLFSFFGVVFAQQASTYFPANNGFKWYYQSTPLDSMQQPVDSLKYYEVDSLSGEGTYLGVTSKFQLTKSGPLVGIQLLPYLDTTYLNFANTDAKEYFRIPNLDSIAAMMTRYGLDTVFGAFNLINTFKSFEKWYTMYKFASSVNASYTIFQYDTTVTIDSVNMPLRFLLKGKRLADKSLATQIGTFDCKVFLMEFSMNYLLIVPPFPAVAVPLLTIPDSVYIAPNQWHVKRVAPATKMSLSQLGFGSYTFPGLMSEILPALPVVGVDKNSGNQVTGFALLQNYPNPFNPGTTIRYNAAVQGKVSLRILNQLGEEVALLTDKEESDGMHEIYWDAAGRASGVYFVQLQTGAQTKMQKIILLK